MILFVLIFILPCFWCLFGCILIASRLSKLIEDYDNVSREEYRQRLSHCFFDRSFVKLFLIGGPLLLFFRIFFRNLLFSEA